MAADHPTHGRRDFNKKLTEGRRAWHRQNGETAKAYTAFTTFLMLGPDRTLADTARTLGKSYPQVARWSSQWHWTLRSAAYEEHYMLLRLESVEAERDAMFVKHRAIASMALALVEGKMNWLMQKLEGDEIKVLNSDEIKMEALVRLLDTASKIERMSVLGRLDAQERSAEEQERLEERYAEELAKFTQDFINGVGLSPDQEAKAKEVLAELLAGESK